METYPASVQREPLQRLAEILDSRASALRRDECGDWRLKGKHGHIYAVPGGYHLVVSTGERPRRWSSVKQRMAFARLIVDGDDEGAFLLARLPSDAEAEIIRNAVGILRRRHLSEEQIEALRARMHELRAAA